MTRDGETDADDSSWDRGVRHETPTERLDRNWSDLLQELRVIQTGVQFLTGFLLTLPLQQRFQSLTDGQRHLYLATLSAAIVSTAFLQAPVSVHRALFRRHQRRRAVSVAHLVAMIGILALGLALVGVTVFIFDVVAADRAAEIAGAACAVLLAVLWIAMPLALRAERVESPEDDNQDARP